jgi:hypothetical protein
MLISVVKGDELEMTELISEGANPNCRTEEGLYI